jgi:RHS repeat-associated protein
MSRTSTTRLFRPHGSKLERIAIALLLAAAVVGSTSAGAASRTAADVVNARSGSKPGLPQMNVRRGRDRERLNYRRRRAPTSLRPLRHRHVAAIHRAELFPIKAVWRGRRVDDEQRDQARSLTPRDRRSAQAPGPKSGSFGYAYGDLLVGGSSGGTIAHYNSAGTLLGTFSSGGTHQITGMCFDSMGDLYATNFNDLNVTKLDDTAQILNNPWVDLIFSGYPESCAVDRAGNVYVGGVSSTFLYKFDANGGSYVLYQPAAESRGIDWIDLSGDNCTIFYTSEWTSIKTFNVCTGTQGGDFATGLPSRCYALRIRANGEVLVACTGFVVRLSSSGQVIHTYYASDYGESNLFALTLDSDGSSFWVGDYTSGDVVKIDIESGNQLVKFNSSVGVNGLAVYGSPVNVNPPGAPPPEATYGPCDHSRSYYRGKGRLLLACMKRAADPVDLATGAVSSSAVDATMPSLGEEFKFERSYTSLDTSSGELGPGWTDSYADQLLFGQGTVTWRSGSGAQIVFSQQQDGSYQAPVWAGITLTAVGGGYEVVDAQLTHYSFDGQGRLTAVKDRNGEGVSLAYDPVQGTRSSLTDSAGRTVTFEYTQGLLTRLVIPDGRDVRYGYTNGRLTSVTDLRGNTYSYTYDAQGRLWTEVDQNNHQVVKNTYGPDGRISQQEDANHNITQFAWDAPTQTATVTDARNHAWTYTFAQTLLVKQADPYGNTTRYGYDLQSGDLTEIRDPRGKSELMSYDARHNMLTRTAPKGLDYKEVWTYNAFNEPLTYKDGRGNQTDYQYDANGNLTQLTGPDPDGGGPLGRPVTIYTRDPAGTGLIVSTTDPRLKTTQFGYDPTTHQLNSITKPLGEKTTFTYDATGRLKTSVDPRGNVTGGTPGDYTTTYDYDNADHLTKITSPDPDGTGPQTPLITQWAYDPAGNLQTFTNARGQATDYGYDAANHLTSVTAPDPDGGGPLQRPVTQYTDDEVGNLKTRTVAGTHTTNYAYDNANRLATVTSPINKIWTYGYDADGNRTSQLDPNSGTTTYGYDALGRLNSLTFSDSTPSVSLTYDANDNLTQVSDGSGIETRTFDALNKLTGVTRGTNTFSYVYDAANNLTQTTYPDNTVVTRGYDDDERLASAASGGLTTSYGYDPASDLTTTTLPSGNGYVDTRTYDRAGRLTGVTNKKGATTLSAFAWTLDPDGNPTSSVRTGATSETDTYTYDNLDRLTSVCFQASCPGGSDPFIRWTYDDVGNRLTEARPSGTTNYTYNNSDQLTQAGSTTYTYDSNGNEKTVGATTFNYNMLNQLTSTTSGSTTTTYSYDGLGKRLQASTGSQASKKTNYLWDLSSGLPQIALERDGNNSLLRRYIYGARRISMTSGNSTYYFHYDPLGSVVNMTSSSGASEWTDSYEPYGLVHSETKNDRGAPTTFMKFAGEYLDPTNLYHLRARQYDPATGRFTTTDPLSRVRSLPYVSSYAYADDKPTTTVDPSGMGPASPCKSFECLLTSTGVLLAGCAYGVVHNLSERPALAAVPENPAGWAITGAFCFAGGIEAHDLITHSSGH